MVCCRISLACWDNVWVSDSPLLSARKDTAWVEVQGWIIDTEALSVSLPSHKCLKLYIMLTEWPLFGAYATHVSQFVGLLMHISVAVGPGLVYVNRVLASVAMLRTAAGTDFYRLGIRVHSELEYCLWFVEERLDAHGETLSALINHLLECSPRLTSFSDESITAVRVVPSNIVYPDDMISTPGNGLDFTDRVRPLQNKTIRN